MVDESERMLKRLDELIRKCDLSEQEITAFSSVKTFKMTREKLDDNCKCIYEPSKCILAWKELQRTRPPVDQLAEIEEEERMERLFREGKAKGMCGCCDCWPDDLSEEESMEWMTGRSSALMVNAYSTPRAFPNALIQHTKELLIGSPASSPSDISDKSGITSSSSKRSTNSVNKKKKGARGKRASGSGMTMAEKETLDFLRKTDSCHLN
ncbi:uncharacterized protein I206_103054 [Kwoniella pini CBS 10737]|uniref:Uncharacterized protein n=1 Tax=Kwoniella pini CBS 10737 TaxID=1296096 RepID=A0A1B9IAR2_9TREE|nr:uncharacterized protein I206_01942 [Kwoniella pini CBS 10737]OCF52649.1 hypothetical protein I206_01942 [Kwoniella pini CBS 10737]